MRLAGASMSLGARLRPMEPHPLAADRRIPSQLDDERCMIYRFHNLNSYLIPKFKEPFNHRRGSMK